MLGYGVVIGIYNTMLFCAHPNGFKKWYWNEQDILGVYLLVTTNLVEILVSDEYISFYFLLEMVFIQLFNTGNITEIFD